MKAATAELAVLIDEAKSLAEKGDMAGAQKACRSAWQLASPEHTPDACLADAVDELHQLGNIASRVGDLETAHAARVAVHRARSTTLPDNHPDLQAARNNLALSRQALGDLNGALALQEKVLEVFSRTLPDDHSDLQKARENLAGTMFMLGDLQGALALQEKVLAILSLKVTDDALELQKARHNLATLKQTLGDLNGALSLNEQALGALCRTLADDAPILQTVRLSVAGNKRALGDIHGALVLQEKVLEVRSRALPPDHPELQRARAALAGTKWVLGDLQSALALQEQAYAVLSRILPDDHRDVQVVRHDLAGIKLALGDSHGALALLEKVLEVRARTLPENHPQILKTRSDLAATKTALGDLHGALAVQEQILAIMARTFSGDHPELLTLLGNIANTKQLLGNHQDALALQEQVLATRTRTLPDDHPNLQLARNNLAWTKKALGDLRGALALQEQVLATRTRTLPDDHPDLQLSRANLALTKWALGDLHAAVGFTRSEIAGALAHLSTAPMSTRDVAQLAVASMEPLSHAGSLLDSDAVREGHALPPELVAAMTRESVALLAAANSAQSYTVELLRTARVAAPLGLTNLLQHVTLVNRDLDTAINLPPEGRTDRRGQRVTRDDAIREATLAKDAAERALLATVPTELQALPTTQALAAGLSKDEAAIAFLTYTRSTNDPEKPWITTDERRFAAFVLTPTGSVTWHSLAPVAEVEPLIASIRQLAFAGSRGERVEGEPSLEDQLTALRRKLFDPLLAKLPTDTKRVVLSLADELQLVPIEDLPMADGATLGQVKQVQVVPSLRSLVTTRPDAGAKPTVLALGSVDYDQAPKAPAPVVPGVATPIVAMADSGASRSGNAGAPGENATPKAFMPLFNTEAQRLGKLFAWAIKDAAEPIVLREAEASEATFVSQAPGKTFLHLATHGYFAPESAWNATDARGQSALARFDVGRDDRVAQLSPFSLAGIALAGANLPADALGRREGILTAQEITQLDLSSCYLATLSACNTSLGVRRGGTGLASLRQAFHAAGARFVLATLWEINDVHAEALMTDFYTRLWKKGEDPRTALRAAKMAAKEKGVPFRDWAGWMITGR